MNQKQVAIIELDSDVSVESDNENKLQNQEISCSS